VGRGARGAAGRLRRRPDDVSPLRAADGDDAARRARGVTGLYSLNRGVGTSLGPLLAGVAIQAAGGDYRWMWLVCGAAILVSIPVMAPLRDEG
jgi:MFS family permease